MAQNGEILQPRETYFASVNLDENEINCGDDRASDLDTYVHVFGGVIFAPYTLLVMQKINAVDNVQNFEQLTRRTLPLLTARGINKPGVHSDDANEPSGQFDAGLEGNIGCGYAGKRADISVLIARSGDEIINECSELMPQLFDSEGRDFAAQVIRAHGELAADADLIGSGRRVVSIAAELGAHVAMFHATHSATAGIINTKSGSSFLTGRALAGGQPAYDHDVWASLAMLKMLEPEYPLDEKELQIASLIDVVGTMKALGVTHICVR